MTALTRSSFPPNEFWDFSSRVYAREGVAAACLGLQERHQLDINLLLYCAWVAASGRGALQAEELAAARRMVDKWRQGSIMPLRQLREFLKGDVKPAPRHLVDDLRRVIVESELHAEHIAQLILSEAISRPADGPYDPVAQVAGAAGNLEAYLAAHGAELSPQDRADLRCILAAVFPGVRRGSVEQAVA